MSKDNVNNFYTSTQQPKSNDDDLSSAEHLAIESMMLSLKVLTDYMESNEFLDICTGLECSPAYREFAKRHRGINSIAAAKLLLAGKFYAEHLKAVAK